MWQRRRPTAGGRPHEIAALPKSTLATGRQRTRCNMLKQWKFRSVKPAWQNRAGGGTKHSSNYLSMIPKGGVTLTIGYC